MCRAFWHCHCTWGQGAAGPQKPEGSRCSEIHSQPYLRPKCVIPDEKYFSSEKAIYLVTTSVYFAPMVLICNYRSPIKKNSWSQSSFSFFTDFQGSIIFFKEFQGTIIFFNSKHAPLPLLREKVIIVNKLLPQQWERHTYICFQQ